MTTTADDVWQLLAELVQAQKETERRLEKIEAQIKEIQDDRMSNPFNEVIEWQPLSMMIRLFQERGIDIELSSSGVEVERFGASLSIDIFLMSATEAILIQEYNTLTQRDVDEHLERLSKFKKLMPRYQNMKAYGAVAAMVVSDEVANYAYGKGLFVLAQSGENMTITNSSEFKPQVW